MAFRYPKTDVDVIKNFSLNIEPGSTLILTGPSGAGKSTILNLLLGELTPTAGTIDILAGQSNLPIQEVRQQLLQNIGYVGPESFLFEGSVYSNITYGIAGEISPQALDEAIKQADCEFLHDLPGKLQHQLTEQGQGLSAGQKQRLALVRALLRKPQALILDEATSNLDVDTEDRLINTFEKLKGQMTIVAVSHRQGLLRIADKQVRLD